MQRIITRSEATRMVNNDLDITQETIDCYNPDSCCCQRCGKIVWSEGKVSSYRRGLTYVHDGKRVDADIMVPVYLCSKCGKSDRPGGTANGDYYHAILPDSLLPFTYYTLLFVLTVLDEYAKRVRTVQAICSYWEISVSTLYRWKTRYMEHYEAWADSLDSIRNFTENLQEEPLEDSPVDAMTKAIGKSLERVFHAIASLPSLFFRRFLFSFLQPNCLTHFRPLPGKRRT